MTIVAAVVGVILLGLTGLILYAGYKVVGWVLDGGFWDAVFKVVGAMLLVTILASSAVAFLDNLAMTILGQVQQSQSAEAIEVTIQNLVGVVGIKMETGWLTATTLTESKPVANADEVYGGGAGVSAENTAVEEPQVQVIPGVPKQLWDDKRALALCLKLTLPRAVANEDAQGGAEWFPINTRWSITRKTGFGFFTPNSYMVTSTDYAISFGAGRKIGENLWKLAQLSAVKGQFEGTNPSFPDSCYQNWAPAPGEVDPFAEFRSEPLPTTAEEKTIGALTPESTVPIVPATTCPSNGSKLKAGQSYAMVYANGQWVAKDKASDMFGSPEFTGVMQTDPQGKRWCLVSMDGAQYPVAVPLETAAELLATP